MARIHAAHWISEQAKSGLKELPSNAAWLLSKVQPSDSGSGGTERAEEVKHSARARIRSMKDSVVEAAPLTADDSVGRRIRRARHDDSVEARMSRARRAAEEALSHPRPYRDGLPPRDALTRIRVLGRYTLDGDIVDTLASELDVLLEGEVLSSRSA